MMGLNVCAVDIDYGKLAHAGKLGAGAVVNVRVGDSMEALRAATGGRAHGMPITAPALRALKRGVGMTGKHGTSKLVGLLPGEFQVLLFDVVDNCITVRESLRKQSCGHGRMPGVRGAGKKPKRISTFSRSPRSPIFSGGWSTARCRREWCLILGQWGRFELALPC
jgi:D-arabinose 1-dehydrogenase-like Zn-dependent alcohol dehydrogenase